MLVLEKEKLAEQAVALTTLLLLAPTLVLVYPVLIFLLGKPVLFKQKRMGQNGREFLMYKLRSMNRNAEITKSKYLAENEAPWPMFKISADPRFVKKKLKLWPSSTVITWEVGKFLSRSGLDELPQLWNILRGEMSLVGPRPLPVSEALELEKIDPAWSKWRSSTRPGIFSAWALDPEHNKSFEYWKKLERKTLKIGTVAKTSIIFKVVGKQLRNLLT